MLEVGADEQCLAAVLFRPGRGQQLQLSSSDGWQGRMAAAIIDLGGGFGCRMASVYGHTGATAAQKKALSGVLEGIVADFRSRGRGPCLIGGDFNAVAKDLDACELLARAGWADWSLEATCTTANTRHSRRVDQVWLSGEMQARLGEVRVEWASGLCTHALQEGTFEEGEPSSYDSWQLGDPGPPEDEQGFSDDEFWEDIAGCWPSWLEASGSNNVEVMWELLEASVCRCHRLRSASFVRPEAQVAKKFEEPRRDLHHGDLAEQSLAAATFRKRRLQQWLSWHLKPESEDRPGSLGTSSEPWPRMRTLCGPQWPCSASHLRPLRSW